VSYIGVQPTAGQYRKLDDISASFNGSTTSFTTSVGGTNVTAGTAQQLLVSVGGVIQEPDADYTVSTNTITFTTAPASGLDFFAVLMGDALNTVTTSDGSITTAKLAGSLSVGLAAGTNSAPSLYFTGDSNTGVYSPGVDQVAVTTGGTQRLSIDSSGNVNIDSNTLYVDAANNRVGLGTNSPARTLDVSGTFRSSGRIEGSSDAVISDWIYIGSAAGARGITSDAAARSLLFGINGAEVARFDTSGRLGIGTTPSATLHVNGAQIFNGVSTIQSSGVTRGYFGDVDGDTNIQLRSEAQTVFKIGNNEAARIDASRRLLVGTSTSVPVLSSATGAAVQVNSTAFGSYAQTWFYGANNEFAPVIMLAKSRNTTYGSYTVVQNNDQLGGLWFAGDDGTDLNQSGAKIEAFVDGTPGNNDMPGRLVFSTTADGASSPTEAMRITSSQEVLIGGTVDIGPYALQVKSTGVWGAGAYVNGSDRSIKEDIEPLASSIEIVKRLNPVSFRYKEDFTKDTALQPGFVAQDLQQAFAGQPYLDGIVQAGPEFLSVAYQSLIPVLTKALQEAVAKIETLEAEVAALKGA
jgi:hypothetical protein